MWNRQLAICFLNRVSFLLALISFKKQIPDCDQSKGYEGP